MLTFVVSAVLANLAHGQTTPRPFTPVIGQEGKDVVWVPTPPLLIERMLDMAHVTPQDVVMDLGSGDGRMVIAAAKRGARAIGVEYNPKMVDLSRRDATAQGVGDKATFLQGDMFEADLSQASVFALFLLEENLNRLRPKFLDLAPGTRIVVNTFGFDQWDPDATLELTGDECTSWCSALLWTVPARSEGTWRLPKGEMTITQTFQKLAGTLTTDGKTVPILGGRLAGDRIVFVAGDAEYSGRVSGDVIDGAIVSGGRSEPWRAERIQR